MKLCTIGCGGYSADVHGPAQQKGARLGKVQLAACCDLNESRAENYRARFGFERSYRNFQTMIDRENPDAICLIVPTHVTCELAVDILGQGIPLFIEKPPGLGTEELERMWEAANFGKVPNQVAFNRRYMPVVARAHEILETHLPPEAVQQINYEMTRFNRRDADFSTTAIHAIDAVSFLARSPYSEFQISYREMPWIGKGVAAFTLEGKCERATQVRINIQPIAGKTSEDACIHAGEHTLRLSLLGADSRQFQGCLEHWQRDHLQECFQATGDLIKRNGTWGEFAAFLSGVRTGHMPSPNLGDCRQQMVLMEALRQRLSKIDFLSSKKEEVRISMPKDPVIERMDQSGSGVEGRSWTASEVPAGRA